MYVKQKYPNIKWWNPNPIGRISIFEKEKGQKMSPLTGLGILMDFYYQDVTPTALAASHEPSSQVVDNQRSDGMRFMAREQVRKEQGTFHEPL